jgi:hypothetical protein
MQRLLVSVVGGAFMTVPAFRLNHGRVTIRYGEGTRPQILWDGVSLVSAINAQIVLDELVPDACTALSLLCEKEAKVGYRATDLFFESFTSVWISLLSQGKIKDAAHHWIRILTLVRKWEEASRSRIHKGSPYYFLGATYLHASDFDLGMRYLFSAIEQDKETGTKAGTPDSYKTAPAYMVASLVNDPRNLLFESLVSSARNRLDNYLAEYRKRTKSSMRLNEFEVKFLNNASLEFQKLFFVYVLFELMKHEVAWEAGMPNDFAKMRNRAVLFDLCLVIDEALRSRYPSSDYISDGVYNLCKDKGWISADSNARQLNQNLNPRVTGDTTLKPDVTVPSLLDLRMTYRGAPVTESMSWFLLAWHLRNYAAHDLTPQTVLVGRYGEIIQALMNALFMTVE